MSLKKLSLNREALRTLGTDDQNQVQGGISFRCDTNNINCITLESGTYFRTRCYYCY